MKNDNAHLHLDELKKVVNASNPVPKSALRSFYSRFDSELTEQAFRRILYKLEKRQVLTPIGAGMYAHDQNVAPPSKNGFQMTSARPSFGIIHAKLYMATTRARQRLVLTYVGELPQALKTAFGQVTG